MERKPPVVFSSELKKLSGKSYVLQSHVDKPFTEEELRKQCTDLGMVYIDTVYTYICDGCNKKGSENFVSLAHFVCIECETEFDLCDVCQPVFSHNYCPPDYGCGKSE